MLVRQLGRELEADELDLCWSELDLSGNGTVEFVEYLAHIVA